MVLCDVQIKNEIPVETKIIYKNKEKEKKIAANQNRQSILVVRLLRKMVKKREIYYLLLEKIGRPLEAACDEIRDEFSMDFHLCTK